VITWALWGFGFSVGGVLLVLGLKNGLRRFIYLGIWCAGWPLLFSTLEPAVSQFDQMISLLGISGGFVLCGCRTLIRFLRLTQPRHF
jgi:hypothetical protein